MVKRPNSSEEISKYMISLEYEISKQTELLFMFTKTELSYMISAYSVSAEFTNIHRLIACQSRRVDIHSEPLKRGIIFLTITLANLNRFL